MRRIAGRAGLSSDRKLTNHSVRKTCCSRLLHAGVPPTAVAQLSGHKKVESLNHYNTLNDKQQRALSSLLNNENPVAISNIPGKTSLDNITRKALPASSVGAATSTEIIETRHIGPEVPVTNPVNQPVVFNIHNTGGGSIQVIYGEKTQLSKNENEYVSNTQNMLPAPEGRKRKRILPLMYDSDSDIE